MGSSAQTSPLPSSSDPSLVLAHPTEAEKRGTWTLNHDEWGGPLNLEAYLEREPFLASTPLAAVSDDEGGLIHWILTEEEGEERRVLASCETLRKTALCVHAGGSGSDEYQVREGCGYGIGSVYTYPEFRGRGYAGRMLRDVGEALKTKKEEKDNGGGGGGGKSMCSTLWSDIGKQYYASKGWPAFPSQHVEFSVPLSSPPTSSSSSSIPLSVSVSVSVSDITAENIDPICSRDETLLRQQLVQHAQEKGRTAFAYAPRPDIFRWHWARQDFVSKRVFPGREISSPSLMMKRGIMVTVQNSSSSNSQINGNENGKGGGGGVTRMWAIWAAYYGKEAADHPERNHLYILRFVIDDDDDNDDNGPNNNHGNKKEILQQAFDQLIISSIETAREWNCGVVELWDPSSATRDLVAGCCVPSRYVDRDDSVPSLMWYGPEDEKDVDWLANEKYCWC
ncbi:hypothetical protein GGS20DRAFT_396654 [Poronia punctata]|nr:hypothetical protein GGS20DRAFT_396654 [Poronia punctata]